jgi:hypothetical protein
VSFVVNLQPCKSVKSVSLAIDYLGLTVDNFFVSQCLCGESKTVPFVSGTFFGDTSALYLI